MWTLKNVKTQKITTKLAAEFMDMDPAPHDRALSERRLQVYEKLVRSGQWRPCIWAKAECLETSGIYRVNGKHTSTLFSKMADEFPDYLATIETYECPTLEDVGRLYGQFDASISSRTTSDINRAFAATIPELAMIARKIIDCCTTAISLHLAGGTRSIIGRLIPAERAERLLEYPEFVMWVNSIISDASQKHKHLCRAGVVGAMLGCYQKSRKDATDFWIQVRDETGARPVCPDRQLARWLLTTAVRSESMGDRPDKRRADIREFYVRSIHCWNSWRRGEELKIVKYHSAAKPPAFV